MVPHNWIQGETNKTPLRHHWPPAGTIIEAKNTQTNGTDAAQPGPDLEAKDTRMKYT